MAVIAGRADDMPMMEINTTPLIDVLLVLLIMFIITIPIQTHSVDIDLPTRSVPPTDVRPDLNRVAIEPQGQVLWNGAPVDLLTLRQYLDIAASMPRPPELQLHPHAEARYERVDEVLAVIRRSNVSATGFVGNEAYATF